MKDGQCIRYHCKRMTFWQYKQLHTCSPSTPLRFYTAQRAQRTYFDNQNFCIDFLILNNSDCISTNWIMFSGSSSTPESNWWPPPTSWPCHTFPSSRKKHKVSKGYSAAFLEKKQEVKGTEETNRTGFPKAGLADAKVEVSSSIWFYTTHENVCRASTAQNVSNNCFGRNSKMQD